MGNTTHTEQGRADFEPDFARLQPGKSLKRVHDGYWSPVIAQLAWEILQAAHRVPVVPERATPEMIEAARDLHAYQGAENTSAVIDALAQLAVPNLCIENLAAPVQLPEPVGVLHVFTAKAENGEATMAVLRINDANAEKQPLGYHNVVTEQQVRQLLATQAATK